MDGSIDKQKKSHLHLTEVKMFTWKVDKVDKVNKVELLLQKFICFRFLLRGYFFFFFFWGGRTFQLFGGDTTFYVMIPHTNILNSRQVLNSFRESTYQQDM